MDIQSIIQHNKSLRETILLQNREIQELHTAFWVEINNKHRLNAPVIATGHQPIFYYPGILFKNFLADRLARKVKGSALNFVVDSDTGMLEVPIPSVTNNNEFEKKTIPLKTEHDLVFASYAPSKEEIKKFFESIANQLITNEENRLMQKCLSSINTYKQAFLKHFNYHKDFVQAVTALRTDFEEQQGVNLLNLKIADIANTNAYHQFIFYIISHIDTYHEHFNQAVVRYANKSFQPVKKLERTTNGFELPFWLLKNGKRYPVFVQFQPERCVINSPEGNEYLRLSSDISDGEQISTLNQQITLFPKAPTLTLIIRIFFSDLFIHGTGAVEYEKINNEFIQSFFRLNAPLHFVAASGNIFFPFEKDLPDLKNPNHQYNEIQKWLKEYKRNPEDLLNTDKATSYKAKKKELAKRMQETEPGERKPIHDQMEHLNKQMQEILAEQYAEMNQKLQFYNRVFNSKTVWLERQYPYFIYPQGILTKSRFDANLEMNVF